MKTLLLNPLFTWLSRFWSLGLIVLALAFAIGGHAAFLLGVKILLALGFALLGLVLAAIGYGGWLRRKISVEQDQAGHHFLCPQCLQFGAFSYSCDRCETELEAFQVLSKGKFFRACPECQQQLFDAEEKQQTNIRAYCHECFGTCERETFHQRQVQIIGTVLPQDYATLRALSFISELQPEHRAGYLRHDDGNCLQYVLDCNEANYRYAAEYPWHALHHLQKIWLDTEGHDPLTIARAFDGLHRALHISEEQRRRIVIYIRQAQIDPVLQTRLEAQFDLIRYHVAPENLFSPAPTKDLLLVAETLTQQIPVNNLLRTKEQPEAQ